MFALVLAASTVLIIGLIVAVCWNQRVIQENTAAQMAAQAPEDQQSTEATRSSAKQPTTQRIVSESVDDWEKCRNVKVGYEMKYPSSWNIYSRGPQGNLSEKCGTERPEIVISPENQYDVEKANFGVFYFNTAPNLGYDYSGSRSLEEFLQKYPYGSGEVLKETLVDGKRAIWMNRVVRDGYYTEVLTYNNYTVFVLQQRNVSSESFDQFLASFKFLK